MPRKHREWEQIRPYQPPNGAERNQKAWKPTIHEQRVGISGNPKRRTMKGSSWKTFNLVGRNQLTWEKWQKERQLKAEFEKGERSWRKKDQKVSSLRAPRNGKSAGDFWARSNKRRKLWEIRKGPATNVVGTTLVLIPRRANGGNQWYPRTLGWRYKRRKQPTVKGIQKRWIRVE